MDVDLVLKALANPARREILEWLADPGSFPPQDHPAAEVGVCLKHLQARAGVSQSTASQYLATLERAGLVTHRRLGQWTHYRRDEAAIAAALAELRRRLGAAAVGDGG